jgi:hypothetical protein
MSTRSEQPALSRRDKVQPDTVAALLRQLHVQHASVIEDGNALRSWLRDNIPNRQLRLSLRRNGYGILLDERFGRPPGRTNPTATPSTKASA